MGLGVFGVWLEEMHREVFRAPAGGQQHTIRAPIRDDESRITFQPDSGFIALALGVGHPRHPLQGLDVGTVFQYGVGELLEFVAFDVMGCMKECVDRLYGLQCLLQASLDGRGMGLRPPVEFPSHLFLF